MSEQEDGGSCRLGQSVKAVMPLGVGCSLDPVYPRVIRLSPDVGADHHSGDRVAGVIVADSPLDRLVLLYSIVICVSVNY